MPRVLHKFENQSIQTFFDNVKFMGDLSFAIYFDSETTCDKKTYNFDHDASIYPVSYALVVSFHTSLNLDRLFVVSFNHTLNKLNSVGYLLDEMLRYFDPITVRQLRDCAQAVYEKREKFSLSEMCSCELKFVTDLLKKWLRCKDLFFFSKQKFKISLTGKNQTV